MKPVSIGDDDEVVLTVQVTIMEQKVRFINGYGPQENSNEEVKANFFNKLDEQVKSAQMAGTFICIELDANSKLGSALIPGDPKPQSSNGKLLQRFIEENDLICVNGTTLCEGVTTRFRKTVNSIERSVLDYFIVCKKFFKLILQMKIDEERTYPLTKYSTIMGQKDIKESDHNLLWLKLQLKWSSFNENKDQRNEIFNFKNVENFQNFQNETEKNEQLSKCFDGKTDLNDAANRWITILNSIIKSCFKKIRLGKTPKNSELESLFQHKEKTRLLYFSDQL